MSIFLYGATDCDDTQRTRAHLQHHRLAFTEINIDHDPRAEQFVIFINGGYRSTPTLLLGEGKRRVVLTEPTNTELEAVLRAEGWWP